MIVGCIALAGIGIWPDYLFPFLWISPFLIIVLLEVMAGEKTVLHGTSIGDWRLVVSSAAAALICGWFWEMWNFYSFTKWRYAIPFVHRFQVFEMPIMGYSGYIPFGLECAAVIALLERFWPDRADT
jgi:hypothetical protein